VSNPLADLSVRVPSTDTPHSVFSRRSSERATKIEGLTRRLRDEAEALVNCPTVKKEKKKKMKFLNSSLGLISLVITYIHTFM